MFMQGALQDDLTASGQFIAMDQAGRLVAVSSLIQQRARLAADLSQIEEELRACNNWTALSELAVWCIAKRKSVEAELREIVNKLESRKSELQKQMQQIDRELARHEPAVKLEIQPAFASLVPTSRNANKCNPHLAGRDTVIAQNIGLSHEDICRVLDSEFSIEGRIAPCLPESWIEKFSVTTFLDAYNHPECRGLVHTLFSKQKKRRGLT